MDENTKIVLIAAIGAIVSIATAYIVARYKVSKDENRKADK